MKHGADRCLQDAVSELEIDKEVDLASLGVGEKAPDVAQVAKRSIFVAHVYFAWAIQCYAAGESFTEWSESDCKVRHYFPAAAASDACTHAPRQELRILCHIRHQIEHLVGPVGDLSDLGMARHGYSAATDRARASRSAAKSVSA